MMPVGKSGMFTITGVNTSFAQGKTALTARPYTIDAIAGQERDVLPNSLIIR